MSIAQNSSASLYERCAPVRRFIAFSLLALALLGYGSLPSPNMGFHLLSTPIADASHDSERLLVPQQANEYRGRHSLAVIEHQSDEQNGPIADYNQTVSRRHNAVASPLTFDERIIAQSNQKLRRPPRAPPVG